MADRLAPQTCDVYALRCRSFVKIGFTANLPHRIASLLYGNPFPLELEACLRYPRIFDAQLVENWLHVLLKNKRHRGEWFSMATKSTRTAFDKAEGIHGGERLVNLWPYRYPGAPMPGGSDAEGYERECAEYDEKRLDYNFAKRVRGVGFPVGTIDSSEGVH